jgi:hypothetical protein
LSQHIVSFGGGVNSTAMLLGMYESVCEWKPDLILFADTGGEKPETYAHRDEFSEWLVKHGFPEITTVREERFTLEEECLKAKTLPSIVTGMRSCSDKFKIRPQDRFVKQWEPALKAWANGERVTKLVGFDAGEPWRAKDYSDNKFTVRFPLIEWGWGREECITAIQRHGLSVPSKSSCFFCPEMNEWEILELQQNHPELVERAIQMEHGAKLGKLVQIEGLARTHSWESVIAFHADQGRLHGMNLLPPRPERMPCTCYDGESQGVDAG